MITQVRLKYSHTLHWEVIGSKVRYISFGNKGGKYFTPFRSLRDEFHLVSPCCIPTPSLTYRKYNAPAAKRIYLDKRMNERNDTAVLCYRDPLSARIFLTGR